MDDFDDYKDYEDQDTEKLRDIDDDPKDEVVHIPSNDCPRELTGAVLFFGDGSVLHLDLHEKVSESFTFPEGALAKLSEGGWVISRRDDAKEVISDTFAYPEGEVPEVSGMIWVPQKDIDTWPIVSNPLEGQFGPAGWRDQSCINRWPDCESGLYDPRCCRFPKSCSCESKPKDPNERPTMPEE